MKKPLLHEKKGVIAVHYGAPVEDDENSACERSKPQDVVSASQLIEGRGSECEARSAKQAKSRRIYSAVTERSGQVVICGSR